MSPTVLREKGYRVMIFVDDHPPAHVHVQAAGKEAKVNLDPIVITDNWGLSRRELNEVESIIEKHQDFLLAKWNEVHRKG